MNMIKCKNCELVEKIKTITLKECIKRLKISVHMSMRDTKCENLDEMIKEEKMLNYYYLQNLYKYLALYEQYLELYANETTG